MNAGTYRTLLWVVTVGGVVPWLAYLWLYNPTRRWSLRSLDANGLVYVIGLLYLRSLLGLIFGPARSPSSLLLAIFAVGLALAADGLLWLRLVRFVIETRKPWRRHDHLRG